ncbi:hypothetical protein [Paracoccus benzoatiresistens]|uniref:Uncharacterized protein n=1 Tax=Paracoccus benzoatiresistens TaxID=2997341 RepID=A0ABT4J7V5_9RHOB|nr:hypothetical protein [Paracoccus sp. EF6]MCZ0962438.1 hypothetical protein [Paracoccus sp. EF6]
MGKVAHIDMLRLGAGKDLRGQEHRSLAVRMLPDEAVKERLMRVLAQQPIHEASASIMVGADRGGVDPRRHKDVVRGVRPDVRIEDSVFRKKLAVAVKQFLKITDGRRIGANMQ